MFLYLKRVSLLAVFFLIAPTIAFSQADGSLDLSFETLAGFDFEVKIITLDNDEKIMVGGRFRNYRYQTNKNIIRLNHDGSPDTSFFSGDGDFQPLNHSVRAIASQNDGKYVVGGFFTRFSGVNSGRIVRLNNDGSMDSTFETGIGFNDLVRDIVIQDDGKILVAGRFTQYQGVVKRGIIRLNSDGSIDTTFNMGVGIDEGSLWKVLLQDDGKIIIMGIFSQYDGRPVNNIARLNPDGTFDETFDIGAGFNHALFAGDVYDDGRVLAGGVFTEYDGYDKRWLVRLLPDGSLDESFSVSTYLVIIYSVKILPDNKIIAVGTFNFPYQGGVVRVVRLNDDGSIDDGFNPGNGPNNDLFTLAVQPDGNLLIGGDMLFYDGIARGRIARVNNMGILSTGDFEESNKIDIYPNPVTDYLHITSADLIKEIKVFNVTGQEMYSNKYNNESATVDFQNFNKGVYFIRVTTESYFEVKKIIIK